VALRIHDQNGWRPDRFETSKVFWILLYMDVERKEVLFYERRQTGVRVRLVLEPLTCASGRCGAKIYQYRFVLAFSLSQCLVGICDPLN
jgi:hypothetical protein